MIANNSGRPRPTVEDMLRALAYAAIFVWAALLLIFPPIAYVNSLDFATRVFWLSACGTGALWAALGAVFRHDLKGELPGIIIMAIGPIFYFAAQLYYLMNSPSTDTDPSQRIAFAVYAIVPLLLTLPRMYSLYTESRRLKRISLNRPKLTQSQRAQPGAFKLISKKGK